MFDELGPFRPIDHQLGLGSAERPIGVVVAAMDRAVEGGAPAQAQQASALFLGLGPAEDPHATAEQQDHAAGVLGHIAMSGFGAGQKQQSPRRSGEGSVAVRFR